MIDIIAQTMNYSGATMAGPTIFAIVYSSVTIWCALLSRILLNREMTQLQWISIVIVFIGLGITGLSSLDLGTDVIRGTGLVGKH
jgi:drug/metabolite transporter (DMT)-like permease